METNILYIPPDWDGNFFIKNYVPQVEANLLLFKCFQTLTFAYLLFNFAFKKLKYNFLYTRMRMSCRD